MKNTPHRLAGIRLDTRQGERLKVAPADAAAGLPGNGGPRLLEAEPATLSPRELEHYLFVVESSLQVRKSHQFFLWAQGQLQSLLPHEVLFCVHGDLSRREYSVSRFTGTPFPDQHFAEICHPESGLAAKVIQVWQKGWEEPCLFSENGHIGLHPQVDLLMAQYGLRNLAVHGTRSVNGGANSCFIFARLPQAPGPRQCYLLELLLPHLHTAFVRTMIDERREPRPAAVASVLTGREVEILRWVSEGKSNHQIGDVLRISPLTVKNHVQNILKKLEVQNRTQAVSRAISLKLIASGGNGHAVR
jgi:transcriptional regulator EpsA